MKNLPVFFLIILTSVVLTSCSSNMGHKVVGGKFTVYFNDPNDEKFATSLANYFKSNALLTGKEQDVQLERIQKNEYQLKIIATNPSTVKNLSFEELSVLMAFQSELNKTVFDNKRVELVICNDQFESMYNINE